MCGCYGNGQKLPMTLPKRKIIVGVIVKANQKGWMDKEKMRAWLSEVYCIITLIVITITIN